MNLDGRVSEEGVGGCPQVNPGRGVVSMSGVVKTSGLHTSGRGEGFVRRGHRGVPDTKLPSRKQNMERRRQHLRRRQRGLSLSVLKLSTRRSSHSSGGRGVLGGEGRGSERTLTPSVSVDVLFRRERHHCLIVNRITKLL